MFTASVILDIAIAAIVLLSVCVGAKKGLFRSLADLIILLLSLVGASMAARYLAGPAADLLRPLLEGKMIEVVSSYLSGTLASTPLSTYLSTLNLDTLADSAAADAAALLVESLLYNLTYVLVYIVAFLVIILLLKAVVRVGDLVLKLPLLRHLNALGGILFGALKGVLIVCLLLLLNEKFLLVDSSILDGSYIVPYLLLLLPA